MKRFDKFIIEKKDEQNEVIHSALLDFIKSTKSDWNYITPEDLHKKDLSKYFLLDIREEKAYKEGHIKGANNMCSRTNS